tara:strand:+ start:2533 stop:2781 length:249 start_codon:yes stop_codon:yes gene_type:complete
MGLFEVIVILSILGVAERGWAHYNTGKAAKLRAENKMLRQQLKGLAGDVKALPANTENDALLERIESLEAIATGDHQPKVEA